MESNGSKQSRRALLKRTATGAAVVGGIGTGTELISENARASSHCPYDAVDCTGASNDRVYDDGAAVPDVRITQSTALAYYGHDYFSGQDDYVHQFQLFNFGEARERDTSDSNGEWDQAYGKEVKSSGFEISSPHEVTFGKDSPRAGPGAPREDSTADVIIEHGDELASLIVGHYFPWAGMAYSVGTIAASIIDGATGSDGGDETTLKQTWDNGAVDTDFTPAFTTYTSFRVHVPASPPCQTSNVSITSRSEADSYGSQYVETDLYYSFENPQEGCNL
ncbi:MULTISPECIES: hypothetical protein [Halorussus]|uniref:hypothetical protein n=1 Tax=Halorussus TaxID=1070314 RepID=UPI0020A1D2DC|nr:hypothetical protein [Halorussus vallis]USZ74957.1 hypothetical protein NGM07_16145 [Halorussus vallis]